MWWHLTWDEKVSLGFSSSTLVEGMPEGKNRKYKAWSWKGRGQSRTVRSQVWPGCGFTDTEAIREAITAGQANKDSQNTESFPGAK